MFDSCNPINPTSVKFVNMSVNITQPVVYQPGWYIPQLYDRLHNVNVALNVMDRKHV
jgi:hypothetical protein